MRLWKRGASTKTLGTVAGEVAAARGATPILDGAALIARTEAA